MRWLRSLGGGAQTACTHVPDSLPAPSGARCEECGSTDNVRLCSTCGHLGCRESPVGHARRDAVSEDHSVIVSLPLGFGFTWCYVENAHVR